jgi:hypothetical protein
MAGCDCVCAFRHSGAAAICDGEAVTSIWSGGLKVPLCGPCSGEPVTLPPFAHPPAAQAADAEGACQRRLPPPH